jgi:hypothetical protein
VKDWRRRPEGVNGSQSKFSSRTWAISQNQPETLLFQLGQDRLAIDKLSALGTGLGTATEPRNGASKTTCEIDDKNRLEKQFISSQAFHRTPGGRVREITTGEQFKPRNLESFDPTTQELYRDEFLQQSKQSNQSRWTDRCISSKNNTAEPADMESAPAIESGWSCNTGKPNRAGAQLTLDE